MLLSVAEGRQVDVDSLLSLDSIFEFFTRLQAFNSRIQAQIDALQKK